MGVLGDILKQKWFDKRESRLIDQALARESLAGTNPSKDEVKSFLKGISSDSEVTPRQQALLAAAETNSPRVAQLRRMFSLARAGLSPEDMNRLKSEKARQEFISTLPNAQKADFLNKLSLAPVKEADGVFYNKFNSESPVIANTPEALARTVTEKAKARKYNSEANDQEARTRVVKAYTDANAGTTQAVDVANSKKISESPDLKKVVVNENGQNVIKFVERGPDGQVVVKEPEQRLFEKKGNQTRQNRSLETLWQDSVNAARGELQKINEFELSDPNEIKARALQLFRTQLSDPNATPPGQQTQPETQQQFEAKNPAYNIGDRISHNGLTYEVQGYDTDGEPLLVPVGND